MEKFPVNSSNIKAISYDRSSSTLEVDFITNHSTYQYYGVPENIYSEIMSADSKGKALNRLIKKQNYRYVRIA